MPNKALKNPNAPATGKQLYALHKLTGQDTNGLNITMQQASDMIGEYEAKSSHLSTAHNGASPFSEAHVTIVEGDQGSGKSNTAVGLVVDAYYIDCSRVYCESKGISGVAKGFDRKNRIAKVKDGGNTKYIPIPESYKLYSPIRIFANFHLFGIPYVYIPTFGNLLKWLKTGLIADCWLLLDEYYVGGNARDSMTAFGKEMEKQSYQMRKLAAEVVIITPHARLIDKWTRLTPTKHIMCSFDKKRNEITLTVKEKGKRGSKTLPSYDATQYWGNYWTNERINQ